MTAIDSRPVHRVRGKDAIVTSLRSLLIRTARYGRCRAVSPADCRWAATVFDRLTATLHAAADEPGKAD